MKIKQNMAVFILFFGIALIEAFRSGKWLLALLYVTLGIMFLRADKFKK